MIISLRVKNEAPVTMSVKNQSSVKMTVREATIVYGEDASPPYAGPYIVTPKVEAQTLETARKIMTDDVNIKAIPFFDTSNIAGGQTIYIGVEV